MALVLFLNLFASIARRLKTCTVRVDVKAVCTVATQQQVLITHEALLSPAMGRPFYLTTPSARDALTLLATFDC